MQIIFLIILGIIQGLGEFLPISSSGHLVLFSHLFKIEDSLLISVILHFATLLAVIVIFRKDVLNMIKHPFSKDTMLIVVSTIPTILIVLLLMPLIDSSFGGEFLGFSFLISAGLLFLVQNYSKKNKNFKEIGYKEALYMGIAQGLAVFPGISRSGATITAGLFSNVDKTKCAKFSFLMSIPIIFMSMILEILKLVLFKPTLQINVLGMLFAFITAFIIGILSIKIMMRLTAKSNFKWFSCYLLVIAVLTILIFNF